MFSNSIKNLQTENNSFENENENNNLFFTLAINKLHKRFPIDDINFFDPLIDFNINVTDITLCEQIAKGSYGIVYNGIMNREKYAIKIEDLFTGVEEQVNILSELTILQSYPHEYLVKFYGTGSLSKSDSEAKILIVMELCENGALREKLKEELPWNLVVRLALDITSGLSFLHENDIIHRDIKTTNILVDKDWRAKICDFSFSCHVNSSIKQEFVYGTDEFMSPEIAMGEDFGIISDIFSFGIVLCEMITKQEPGPKFLKRTAQKNCFSLPEDELRAAVLFDCPESLEALTIECCHLESDQRPTAQNCYEWLESLLEELGSDLTSTIQNLSSEKSAIVGVSPIREGTVIYPKAKEVQVARVITRHPSNLYAPKSPALNPSELFPRMSYLEVQVQELKAENTFLNREVAILNKKVEELIKIIDPPSLSHLNSSGRLSIGDGGSNTNTPRQQNTPRQPDTPYQSNRSINLQSNNNNNNNNINNNNNNNKDQVNSNITPISQKNETSNITPLNDSSIQEKEWQYKKLSTEIEYLKFRFSKMSNDIALLKAQEVNKKQSEVLSPTNIQIEVPSLSLNSSPAPPLPLPLLPIHNEFYDALFPQQERNKIKENGIRIDNNNNNNVDNNNNNNNKDQKWTLSRREDSTLVRTNSGDQSKPTKRQSPTSYGLSPPQPSSSSSTSTSLFLGDKKIGNQPSIEIIEVEDTFSSDESEDFNNNNNNNEDEDENNQNIDTVVQSFLDVVGKCSEITNQTQTTLKSLDERINSGELLDKPKRKQPSTINQNLNIHKGTRASPKSQFHYSPHPGFLSQLGSPNQRSNQYNSLSGKNLRLDRPQSPVSTIGSVNGYSVSSSKPSLLSQGFNNNINNINNFPLSKSSNLIQKQNIQNYNLDHYDRDNEHDNHNYDEDEDNYNDDNYNNNNNIDITPPNISQTWRTVQSRTPPNSNYKLERGYNNDNQNIITSGRHVQNDILSITPPPPQQQQQQQFDSRGDIIHPNNTNVNNSSHQIHLNLKSTKPNNKRSNNSISNNSTKLKSPTSPSPSPFSSNQNNSSSKKRSTLSPSHSSSYPSSTLRDMLLADEEKSNLAKSFFQPNLVHNSVFRKDNQHPVHKNVHTTSVSTSQNVPVPIKNLIDQKR